jgi:hypothetical protein
MPALLSYVGTKALYLSFLFQEAGQKKKGIKDEYMGLK